MLRDEFGSIIPPMPSNPVQPSSKIYGQGCHLSLVGDKSDPVAARGLDLLARWDYGTMQNNITRLVPCTIVDGPPGTVGWEVIAIVYDPLYVPLYCLPILAPKEDRQGDAHDNDVKNETAQVDENREDNEHDEHSKTPTAIVEPESWKDYLPPPNPLVTPQMATKTLPEQAQLWDREIQSRAAYAKKFFTKEFECYKKLRKHQGRIIPEFLGSYTIRFDDREHDEDKTVHLLLNRHIKGLRLDRVKTETFDKTTIGNIRAQVLDIQEVLLKEGILWPMLQSQNFTIDQSSSPSRIRAYNFWGTENLESMSEDARQKQIRSQKRFVLSWLDEKFPLQQHVEEYR